MAAWRPATEAEKAVLYRVLDEDGAVRVRGFGRPVLVSVVSWPSETHAFVRETDGSPQSPAKDYTLPRSRLQPDAPPPASPKRGGNAGEGKRPEVVGPPPGRRGPKPKDDEDAAPADGGGKGKGGKPK